MSDDNDSQSHSGGSYSDPRKNVLPSFDRLYRIESKIGAGSYGSVYIGHRLPPSHPNLTSSNLSSPVSPSTDVAVKIINRRGQPEEKRDKAVRREVDVLKSLSNHRNIVSLLDFFEGPRVFCIVLELARVSLDRSLVKVTIVRTESENE